MTAIQAIVLGAIQGLTEFLPISSSGHLIFIPTLFGWEDQGVAFDVVVHLGTLTAVVVYFRNTLWKLIRAFFSFDPHSAGERRFAWLLLCSVIPAAIVGIVLDTDRLRTAAVVGTSLLVWGVVLGIADYYHRRLVARGVSLIDTKHIKKTHIMCIAIAQAVSLIPGTSRSGITMTAGLFAGLDKKTAASCSFLMGVPVIFLAGMVKLAEVVQVGVVSVSLTSLGIGFIVSAISGMAAMSVLMNIITKWSFFPFAVYRVIVGILILIFLV